MNLVVHIHVVFWLYMVAITQKMTSMSSSPLHWR